jgi:hypothetical protein
VQCGAARGWNCPNSACRPVARQRPANLAPSSRSRLTSLLRDTHRTIEQIIAMMCALTYDLPYPHARHDAEARTPGASSFTHNTHSLRCIHHMLANHSKRAAFIFLAVQYRFAAPQWLLPQK